MYFHTDNKFTLQTIAIAANNAAENGRSLRLDVDSEGRLKFKVGEGMWSAPIASTTDPYRDNATVERS